MTTAELFEYYFPPHIGGRAARKKQAKSIATIIVDTENLVTTNMSEPSFWTIHPQQLDTTRQAFSKRKQWESTNDSSIIVSHHGSISAYTRHDGDTFASILFGDVDAILLATSLTENERERVILTARQHHIRGNRVEAVAHLTHTAALATASVHQAEFLGLVLGDIIPYPSIHKSLAHAKQQGISILYISRDTHAFVSGVAHAVGLLPSTKEADRFSRHLPPRETTVLSECTRSAYDAVYKTTDPTTLVAHHPLPPIIDMLSRYRSRPW